MNRRAPSVSQAGLQLFPGCPMTRAPWGITGECRGSVPCGGTKGESERDGSPGRLHSPQSRSGWRVHLGLPGGLGPGLRKDPRWLWLPSLRLWCRHPLGFHMGPAPHHGCQVPVSSPASVSSFLQCAPNFLGVLKAAPR